MNLFFARHFNNARRAAAAAAVEISDLRPGIGGMRGSVEHCSNYA